jgi:hypothetical protein
MTGSGPEPFSDDALRTPGPNRAQQRSLAEAVTRHYPDAADHMPLLRALLAPMRPAIPPHGNQHSSAWSKARAEWLDLVRAWVAGQGRVLASRNVSADDQRGYVEATGNHFQPPEGER